MGSFKDSTTFACGGSGTATCLLILNILFPGLGTVFNSCSGENGFHCKTFLTGWLMGLTSWLLIGWIMSIIWGCEIKDKTAAKLG